MSWKAKVAGFGSRIVPRAWLSLEIARHNRQNDSSIRLRVGICTGPVVAGVIGRDRFAYDLWSETVNVACRLEATAEPGKIQVSESTHERLKDKYELEKRNTSGLNPQTSSFSYWLRKPKLPAGSPGRNGKVGA